MRTTPPIAPDGRLSAHVRLRCGGTARLILTTFLLWSDPGVVAPGAASTALRHASVHVEFTSPVVCTVQETLTIDALAGMPIEHRIMAPDGTAIELDRVTGASISGPVTVVGRTRSLHLQLPAEGAQTYSVAYRVVQPGSQSYRCPLWVPAAPTDGRSRAVDIDAAIPIGASAAGGSLPALAWQGSRGSATLAHLPSLVRVPYRLNGESGSTAGVDVTRMMDLIALVVLCVGTSIFVWRRKGA